MNLMTSNFMIFTTGRDEITDPVRGDEDREAPDEEKDDQLYEDQQTSQPQHEKVSMFSTLTELIFNPFLDGYCKTPFCSDADYMPPSCPAGSFYAAAPEDNAAPQTPVRSAASSEDRHGDICHSNSGASSAAANSNGRRRRRRPLALAVGYGDELKDQEGRRVVITPRAARSYGHNSSCTCNTRVPKSPVQREQDISPHQSKVVMCKYCTTNRLREEGLLPCRSGESIGPATSYGK